MKLSMGQLKGIVDTLPVGFYCGRKIPVELSEKEMASSYNPTHDTITISAKQISHGLDLCKDIEEATSLIRSNFYHELSHAILTPQEMTPTDAVNIFEDERIERVCKDSYYGVDFEESFLKICGGEEALKGAPTCAQEAFMRLVRFHMGEKKYLDKVENILRKYAGMNRLTESSIFSQYKQEIQELYEEYTGEYDQEKEEQKYQKAPGEGSGEGDDEEETGDCSYKPGKGEGIGGLAIRDIAKKALIQNFNLNFHKQVEQLFENYRKKNNKGGSLTGYSGVLNPRITGREDYRFFERPSPLRGGNPYGTLHLNLFIDTSGSFSYNDKATNAILHSLALIERKNPNFSFDVITMGPDEIVLDKKNKYIQSGGGNHLSKKIHRIYRRLQLPQTGNYNIVLFDGDAYSNDCSRNADWYSDAERGKGFTAFANNSCTIISDYQNERYIKKYCPNTHTIITDNYVKELYENVLKALQKALI